MIKADDPIEEEKRDFKHPTDSKGCRTNYFSSRVCERGTKGCEEVHKKQD